MSLKQIAAVCMCLAGLLLQNGAFADDSKTQSSSGKKSVSALVKSCSDREQRTSQKLDKLISDLKLASKSNDPAKMTSALNNAQSALSSLKKDHDQGHQALEKIHQRMEDLKKEVKASRKGHDKASSLLEDEDMDDAVWAY